MDTVDLVPTRAVPVLTIDCISSTVKSMLIVLRLTTVQIWQYQ